MAREKFSGYVKILFLTFLFMCFADFVSAPTKDYFLRRSMITDASEFWELRHKKSEFNRFVADLGRRESGNNWLSVNSIGCFGEWQFKESTLHYLGFRQITLRKFKKDPDIFPRELQRKVLGALIKVNEALLKDYESYIGDTIRGVIVTKSGLLAAAHLGGARSVKLFLSSGGRMDKEDSLGTSVSNYMKKFSFYDID
jgi:hypothetical protein